MSRTVINPDTVFNSVQYGFSQAVVVTGSRRMLLSGQVGIDVHERTVGPGLQEQTEAALDNIERACRRGRTDRSGHHAAHLYLRNGA